MTILILTIDDDGRTRTYSSDHLTEDMLDRMPSSCCELTPTRSGDDRGHYDVFEVAGVSIDVMRLRER